MSHLLVVANETVTGPSLIEAREAPGARARHRPRAGEPSARGRTSSTRTRGARRPAGGSTGRSRALREAGITAHGLVVEADPADAVRDAIAMLEPSADGDHRLDASGGAVRLAAAEGDRPRPRRRRRACRSSTSSST